MDGENVHPNDLENIKMPVYPKLTTKESSSASMAEKGLGIGQDQVSTASEMGPSGDSGEVMTLTGAQLKAMIN